LNKAAAWPPPPLVAALLGVDGLEEEAQETASTAAKPKEIPPARMGAMRIVFITA
jgi:hypothetical protein